MGIRAWAAISLLVLILIAPAGGSPSIFVQIEKFFSRLGNPVTEQERGELAFLDCVEGVGLAIPDRSNVLITAPDAYFTQRSQEILYPRVRLVAEGADYIFAIGSQPEGEVISSNSCGGQEVRVVKID